MPSRRRAAVAVCALLGAAACRGAPVGHEVQEAPRRGGELRLTEEPNVAGWDPLEAGDIVSQTMVSQVYEALVDYAPRPPYAPSPALARSWSVDAATWTFHLRPQARFADDACFADGRGRAIGAADVRYSLERELRARRPGHFLSFMWKLRGARDLYEGRAEHVIGLHTPDDSTVIFELTERCGSFVHAVASCAIVPHEAVETYAADFWQHPVGSGPFRLVRWTPQEAAVLVRNENYWQRDARGEQLPYLDRVILYMVPPRTLPAAAALHVQRTDVERTAGDAGLAAGGRLLRVTRFNIIFLSWNFSRPSPWTRDPRLRQALSRAIHRPSGPAQVPARGLLPPGLAAYDSLRPPLGPELRQAARLLAEAGHAHGRGLPPLRLFCILEETTMMTQTLQPLADLGVSWELVPVTKAQYWQVVPRDQPAFFRWGWIADYPDAENFFELFYGGSGQNVSGFRDARFDSLFAAAAQEDDPWRRAPLYRAMEDLLLEEMPVLFLHHDRNTLVVRAELQDFDLSVNPLWRKRYKYAWLHRPD